MVQKDRPHMKVRRMRIAWCTTKAINTLRICNTAFQNNDHYANVSQCYITRINLTQKKPTTTIIRAREMTAACVFLYGFPREWDSFVAVMNGFQTLPAGFNHNPQHLYFTHC